MSQPVKSPGKTCLALRQALQTLLQRKPLSEITVTELCATAQITRSTFYRHYAIPKDIVTELWQQLDGDLGQRLVALPPGNGMLDRVQTWCRYIDAHRAEWQLLLLSGYAPSLDYAALSGFLRERLSSCQLPPEETELLVRFVLYGTSDLVREWICSPDHTPPERFAQQVMSIYQLLTPDQ